MLHRCELPEPRMETSIGHLRRCSWVHTKASDIPAAHELPPNQPIWSWCINSGGNMMYGDPKIHPNLLVLPINACPFCGQMLVETEAQAVA